jgi:hypothetical protein
MCLRPFNVINNSPGLLAFWKLHAPINDPAPTADPEYIANLGPAPDYGQTIALDIAPGGRVTVTNSRNKFSKIYQVD